MLPAAKTERTREATIKTVFIVKIVKTKLAAFCPFWKLRRARVSRAQGQKKNPS